MTTLPQDDDLLREYLSQQLPAKKHGCFWHLGNILGWTILLGVFAMMVFTFLPDVLVGYGLVAPETMDRLIRAAPTPAAVENREHTDPDLQPRPEPPPAPVIVAPLPDCASVTDTRTACVQDAQPAASDAELSGNDPTPTTAPTPTAASGGFWTEAELAQFRATEEAFYDPATLPTAPPAFVETVKQGCNDPEKRAQSPLLDSWCGPLDE